MNTTKKWSKMLMLGMLALMVTFEVSAKPKDSGPKREGPATILENPTHPDGVYDVGGGISIQFLGETWIQKKGATPIAAGKVEGAPAAPPNFTADEKSANADQMKAFLSSVKTKKGDITLKGTMIYMAKKWLTLEQAKAKNRVPVKGDIVSQDVENVIVEAEKGFTLSYALTDAAPFITVSKK
ncbi:MAG: hypothetical protein Ta2G_16250 [Termitinemataceae bacterium]|nr:MAG: hypothetical protein Ta2G_16250 [Termitinemataceae bacterium]